VLIFSHVGYQLKRIVESASLIRSLLCFVTATVLLQQAPTTVYRDPTNRFTFSYPSTYGSIGSGTADGYLDRVAAFHFSSFPARFGGEPVVTKGFPLIDLQALGGLYDSLTLEVFPEPLRARVVSQLPRLTLTNFCEALALPRHLDPGLPAFASLKPQERDAIGGTDVMRNTSPRVIGCRTSGDTITFDKERAFAPGYPAQHVYGSVRFLTGPYSTFQLIAGGEAPDPSLMKAIEDLVRSFRTAGAD
jgi:hypothetical protein